MAPSFKAHIDNKATNIYVLAAIRARLNGHKVLLYIINMGKESTAAWPRLLDDLDAHGLRAPEIVIIDCEPRLEAARLSDWRARVERAAGRPVDYLWAAVVRLQQLVALA